MKVYFLKNMKIGLLIFVGLPGSGKTTLANTLKSKFKNYKENNYYYIHVCYDNLIPFQKSAVDAEWKATRNSMLLKIEDLIIAVIKQNMDLCPREFINDIKNINYNSNVILVIDDNMYFKSMRYSFYQMAKKYAISFCQVYLRCTLEKAILQNSLRSLNSFVPSNIIENMYYKMEPPNSKNFWEKFSINIDGSCEITNFCDELFSVLNNSLRNPESSKVSNDEERNFSLAQCKKSLSHQVDIALRKLVNNKIKDFIIQGFTYDVKEHIKLLNMRKSEILFDVKVGNINLPDNVLEELGDGILDNSKLIEILACYF